jgi:hypothetical protein
MWDMLAVVLACVAAIADRPNDIPVGPLLTRVCTQKDLCFVFGSVS